MQVKNSFKDAKVLSFKYFNVEDVERDIDNIDSKNATPKDDIPVKIADCNSNKTASILTDSCYNTYPDLSKIFFWREHKKNKKCGKPGIFYDAQISRI